METEYNLDRAREYLISFPNMAKLVTRKAREFPAEMRQAVYDATILMDTQGVKKDLLALHSYMSFILTLNDEQLDKLIAEIPKGV